MSENKQIAIILEQDDQGWRVVYGPLVSGCVATARDVIDITRGPTFSHPGDPSRVTMPGQSKVTVSGEFGSVRETRAISLEDALTLLARDLKRWHGEHTPTDDGEG